MRTAYRLLLSSVLVAGVVGAIPVRADDVKDETEIEEIDSETLTEAQAIAKADALAKKSGVEQATITQMRKDGMGWGGIEISLALAQKLSASTATSTTPLTMSDALIQVMDKRKAGEGWGKIAKDLGFKLGEIVRVVKAKPHDKSAETSATHEKVEKPETSEKPEHMGRPESTGKPQELGKPEKSDKPEKQEKPDKPEKAD